MVGMDDNNRTARYDPPALRGRLASRGQFRSETTLQPLISDWRIVGREVADQARESRFVAEALSKATRYFAERRQRGRI